MAHGIRNLIAFCILCLGCQAAEPKPLLVVSTYGSWSSGTPDAGSPSFTLYDDGTIICYHQPDWGKWPEVEKLYTTRKIKEPKKKIAELLTFDLASAKTHYELTAVTCQAQTIIWTPEKRITIYGDWKNPRRFDSSMGTHPAYAEMVRRDNELWKTFPDEIRQFLLHIEAEIPIAGTPWLPEKIEVMLIAYEYAPNESINWPKGWPGLNDKSTTKRSGSSYSIFLPIKKLSELDAFLASVPYQSAVLIEGHKMSASYRLPFPHEELWAPQPLESFQE